MMPTPAVLQLSNRTQHSTGDLSLRRQLSTVREMLASLETLTIAGRQNLMIKVVAFIRGRGGEALERVGQNNQGTAAALLEHLAVESERRLPDARAFGPRAESLVALLAAVA
jgi:hypothetical protein